MGTKRQFLATVAPARETLTTGADGTKSVLRTRQIAIADHTGKTLRTLEAADDQSDIDEKITKAGYIISRWDGDEAELTQRPSTGGQKAAIGCAWGGLAFLVLTFVGCSVIMNNASRDNDNDSGSAVTARIACQDMVKDKLKSPGSAKFTGQTESGSGNSWTARGSVDSQNGFGALIRSTYSCSLTYTPSDKTWRGQAQVK